MTATIIATAVAYSGLQLNNPLRLNGWAAALFLTRQYPQNGVILPGIYLKNFKKGSKTEISPP